MPPKRSTAKEETVPGQLGIWILHEELGRGAFSGVYRAHVDPAKASLPGVQALVGKHWVLKVSKTAPPTTGKRRKKGNDPFAGARLLNWEYTMYQNFLGGHPSVPRRPLGRLGFGEDAGWKYLVLQQLGDTLTKRVEDSGGRFTVQESLRVGLQALAGLKLVHAKTILFRDIKPDNFMFGMEDPDKLYMVDFGAAVRFKSHHGTHLDQGKGETGTPMFMSMNVHENLPPSRRDDLESWFYLVVWMMLGDLPWGQASNNDALVSMKKDSDMEDLLGRVPDLDDKTTNSLLTVFEQIKNLEIADTPDYADIAKTLGSATPAKPSRKSTSTVSRKKPAGAAKKAITAAATRKPRKGRVTKQQPIDDGSDAEAIATSKTATIAPKPRATTKARPPSSRSTRATRTSRARKPASPEVVQVDSDSSEDEFVDAVGAPSPVAKKKSLGTTTKTSTPAARAQKTPVRQVKSRCGPSKKAENNPVKVAKSPAKPAKSPAKPAKSPANPAKSPGRITTNAARDSVKKPKKRKHVVSLDSSSEEDDSDSENLPSQDNEAGNSPRKSRRLERRPAVNYALQAIAVCAVVTGIINVASQP